MLYVALLAAFISGQLRRTSTHKIDGTNPCQSQTRACAANTQCAAGLGHVYGLRCAPDLQQQTHGHGINDVQNSLAAIHCIATANMGSGTLARNFQACYSSLYTLYSGVASAVNHCGVLLSRCQHQTSCNAELNHCAGNGVPTRAMISACGSHTRNPLIRLVSDCFLRYVPGAHTGNGGSGSNENLCLNKHNAMGAYCMSHLATVYHCSDSLMARGCAAYCCLLDAPLGGGGGIAPTCRNDIMGTHCSRLIQNHGCTATIGADTAGSATRHGCAHSCRLTALDFPQGACPTSGGGGGH